MCLTTQQWRLQLSLCCGGKTGISAEEFRAPELALTLRNYTFHALYRICRGIRILTDCFNLRQINQGPNFFMLQPQREPLKCKTSIIKSLQGGWNVTSEVLRRQGNIKQIWWLAGSDVVLSVEFELGIIFLFIFFKSMTWWVFVRYGSNSGLFQLSLCPAASVSPMQNSWKVADSCNYSSGDETTDQFPGKPKCS